MSLTSSDFVLMKKDKAPIEQTRVINTDAYQFKYTFRKKLEAEYWYAIVDAADVSPATLSTWERTPPPQYNSRKLEAITMHFDDATGMCTCQKVYSKVDTSFKRVGTVKLAKKQKG